MKTLAAVAMLAMAAAPSAGFRAGLWEVRNVPGQATLDGHPLKDLPVKPAHDERVCMSAAQAAHPAAWLARDNAHCAITRAILAGGKVTIAGACPPTSADTGHGSFRQRGTWTATSFDVTFSTQVTGDNGRMGFGGHMTGRRIGDCPG